MDQENTSEFSRKKITFSILILEDVESDAELLQQHITDMGFVCKYKVVSTKQGFEDGLKALAPDIVFADFNLPTFDGVQALEILRKDDKITPFIFITGFLQTEYAVKAIRLGATDFILKNNLEQLPAAMLKALREKKERLKKLQIQQQLVESEKRFRALVQKGNDIIAILDVSGNIKFISESIERILGLSVDQLHGKNLMDLIHPDDKEAIKSQFYSLIVRPEVKLKPYRIKDSKGNWRYLETHITNRLGDSSVKGIIANTRDVSQNIEQEKLLELNNDLYHFAAIAGKDQTYDWNLVTQEVYRPDKNENLPDPGEENSDNTYFWRKGIHPEDKDAVLESLRNSFGNPNEDFWKHIYRYENKEGDYGYLFDKGYIMRDEKGKAIRMVGYATDITESMENRIQT